MVLSQKTNVGIQASTYLRTLGAAYNFAGRYEDGITAFKKALNRSPNDLLSHVGLAQAYSMAGRMEEAHAEAEQVLKINPKFSLEYYAKQWSYKNQADKDLVIYSLRKAGLPEHPPLPLPDKPSIAVLPFVNMSGDPEQEYFSDGISEEIITALSKTPKLFVIARTSSFTYKSKDVDVRTVGRELGVRYVLEGSVRKAGNKVRITAQLIDAKADQHLWAERYDRDLKDIFAIQDEIAMKIMSAMQVELTEGDRARLWTKGTDNLEAYLTFLKGVDLFGFTTNSIDLARKMFEKAISLDSNYPQAYRWLANTHMMEVVTGLSKEPKQSIARAIQLTKKALDLHDSLASAYALLGWLYTMTRQHDKGIAECEKAVTLDPNYANGYFFLSLALRYASKPEEAILMCKKAIRLDPIPQSRYFQALTNSYCLTCQYDKAISAGERAIDLNPDNLLSHAFLAVAYSLSGREEEARGEAAEVIRLNPKFLVESWKTTMPFKKKADLDLVIGALRKAGLK